MNILFLLMIALVIFCVSLVFPNSWFFKLLDKVERHFENKEATAHPDFAHRWKEFDRDCRNLASIYRERIEPLRKLIKKLNKELEFLPADPRKEMEEYIEALRVELYNYQTFYDELNKELNERREKLNEEREKLKIKWL